jgi:DNA-binding PadR family transcriptional regulator
MSEAQATTDTPSIAHELSAFQQNILAILAEDARYGLAIKRELEDYYEEDVNHGRLYPNLDDLVDLGLVEKGELDKRTNEYELTEEGYDALLEQLGWTFERMVSGNGSAEEIKELVKTSS